MATYASLSEKLTGRCAQRRKLTHNTYAERRGDDIAVKLHNTDILTFHPDETVTLDTGGWLTVTTKERMNRYLPDGVGVYSERGRWFVRSHGSRNLYEDGMSIASDGRVLGIDLAEVVAKAEREDAANVKMRKDVQSFVKSITPEQIVTAWENTSGDCWGCMLVAEDGTHPMGQDCLAQHVEERYFHAHLALRAIKAQKYHNPDAVMYMIYAAAKRGVVDTILTRNLRRFLYRNLTVGACAVA